MRSRKLNFISILRNSIEKLKLFFQQNEATAAVRITTNRRNFLLIRFTKIIQVSGVGGECNGLSSFSKISKASKIISILGLPLRFGLAHVFPKQNNHGTLLLRNSYIYFPNFFKVGKDTDQFSNLPVTSFRKPGELGSIRKDMNNILI